MVRQKNRYILCELVFPNRELEEIKLTDKVVYLAVREAIVQYHGDYGLAVLQQALTVKYLNPATRILFIRAARSWYKLVTTALPFIQKIGTEEGFFKTLHIGGTIRSCQKFLARYNRQQLVQLLRETVNPDDRAKIQRLLLESDKPSKSLESLMADRDDEEDEEP